jgi:hypothetical protein
MLCIITPDYTQGHFIPPSVLDQLYAFANVDRASARSREAVRSFGLKIAGFVALDLLRVHTQTRRQMFLRQSRSDARLTEYLRQSFKRVQFKNFRAALYQPYNNVVLELASSLVQPRDFAYLPATF